MGYDKIPATLPVAPPGRGLTRVQQQRRRLVQALADAGLTEVLAYPFVSKAANDTFGVAEAGAPRKAVKLANPISEEHGYLRTSVLPGLIEVAKRNHSRGFRDLALFEAGLVFLPGDTLGTESRLRAARWEAVPSVSPGRKTSPASNRARSRKPREWFRLAVSIRPGRTGAQVAVLLADRVGELSAFVAHPPGHAEGVVGGLGDERVGEDLGQARIGQGLDQAPALLLDAGQAAARRRHRQGRRDLVVADEPGDFLGEVFLGFQVVPPARRGNRPAVVGLHDDGAEVLEAR